MKIIEITGFVVSFSLDTNKSTIPELSKKINYGGGSLYQKFKSTTSEKIHEELKSIKDVDFYMNETISQSFKFTVVEKEFETVRKFAKVITKLFKEIHDFNSDVNVVIEQTMLVTEVALEFKI